MKVKILWMVLLAAFSCTSQNEDKGWKELFNGTSLEGWKIIGGTGEFEIQDNIIVGTGKLEKSSTFLATIEEYDDFILEYETFIELDFNSGVQIRSNSKQENQNQIVYGYQVELDPSKRSWAGGIYEQSARGWLYNLECNPKGKEAFKNDAWNKFRVEAIGNNIRVWVNGIQTADLIDDKASSGFIALQVHGIGKEEFDGKKVKFKKIRVATENLVAKQTPANNDIPQVSYLKNKLTEREITEGWKLLWDGKTGEGWRGAKLDNFPTKGWQINDGLLTVLSSGGGEARNGGDIVTVKKYKNFELEVDFKITEGANSGIKYFVNTGLNKGEGSAIGCEFQILDDAIHPDAKKGVKGNRTIASLYDLIPANALQYAPNESTSKRVNKYKWNRAKVVVDGQHVAHYLNGIKVVEYERGTQTWKALVAYSKYHKWPNFGEFEEGHLLLQDHGDEVHFKNIKIKELN